MQLQYGNYLWPSNETGITTDSSIQENQGGLPFEVRHTIHVAGVLLGDGTQATLIAASAALQLALSIQFRDLTFFSDSGAVAFSLLNATSVSGVRIRDFGFPQGTGPEFSTMRHYKFTAEASYTLANPPALLDFSESLTLAGGAPKYVVLPSINALPQRQLIYPAMPFTAQQSGHATGYLTYPTAPAPIFPNALKEGGSFTRQSPNRRGQVRYSGYRLAWQYAFESPFALAGLPNFWRG